MASIVDICNGALNQLGASTILSLTEDSKNARLCNARFTQQYTLPADCLRVLTILDHDSDYKIEGRKILTDNSSMKILYISRVTDPNEYDELLRETLSAALAADIAYAITSSNPTTTNMFNLFQSKLKDARFVDSTEGQNLSPDKGLADVIGADTFINSRF